MTTEKIGAAVIGMRMGRAHAKAYADNPNTRLVAVCDTNAEVLEQARKEYPAAEALTDFRALLGRRDIRIVSVASPDYFHAEHSIACMEAGKDVLCEKPMTLTLDEARSIAAAVKRTGRRFMTGQVCRFTPGFVQAKRLIDRGDIGELYFVESEYAHHYGRARGVGDWRVDSRREPFIGGGCHAVDLLRWVAGHPTEAFAWSNHKCLPDWPVNDCTICMFKFPNNVLGKVFVSIGCARPYTMRSVFYGTEGTIITDNRSPEMQVCSKRMQVYDQDFARIPVPINNHNVTDEAKELVNSILENRAPTPDVYEGGHTVAACVAAVESARTGRPARVERLD